MVYEKHKKIEILREVTEGNEWAITVGIPTRKYDGTACMVKDNTLYKRYDSKISKKTGVRKPLPEGAIACIPVPDSITGHWPHWVQVDFTNPENHSHKKAWEGLEEPLEDGTYELCGPKINKGKDNFEQAVLVKHGITVLDDLTDRTFDGISKFLEDHLIEGIVFHHPDDDRMCKIRRRDFGFKW